MTYPAAADPAAWQDGRRPRLTGAVSSANAVAVRSAGEALVAARAAAAGGNGRLVLDLAGVTSRNSVTVAVLLGLVRAADRHAVSLAWQGLPAGLAAIITFSGLDPVFGLGRDTTED